MVKGNDIIGKTVIGLHDGAVLGKVKDLIYNPDTHTVEAFLLEEPSLFSQGEVVLITDIHAIGADAIMVESPSVLQKLNDVPGGIQEIAKDKQYLNNTKIVTEKGVDLGTVTDIYFDEATGKAEEFEVSQGLVKNFQSGKKRVRVRDILTIGENATIVTTRSQTELHTQGESQGLRGVINMSKQKAEETMEATREKWAEAKDSPQVQDALNQAQRAVQQAGRKLEEAKESQTAKDIADVTKMKIDETKQAISKTAKQYRRQQLPESRSTTMSGIMGGKSVKIKGEAQVDDKDKDLDDVDS